MHDGHMEGVPAAFEVSMAWPREPVRRRQPGKAVPLTGTAMPQCALASVPLETGGPFFHERPPALHVVGTGEALRDETFA